MQANYSKCKQTTVNASTLRPGQALIAPGVWVSQNF